MANISNAYGTVYVTAPDKKSLAQFLYLQVTSEKGRPFYNTTLTSISKFNLEQIQAYVEEHAERSGGFDATPTDVAVSLNFKGTGKWSFERNANWFFSMFQEDSWFNQELKKNSENYTSLNNLKQKPFHAEFDVVDSEPGLNFIDKYTVRTSWDPKSQKQIHHHTQTHESNDYTATNLIEYGFYKDGDVWDIDYVLSNFDFFVEQLELNDSTDTDFLVLRGNILNNPDGFKELLKDPKYDYAFVEYDLEHFLLEVLELGAKTVF